MAHSSQGLKEGLASSIDGMLLTSGFSGHKNPAREIHLKLEKPTLNMMRFLWSDLYPTTLLSMPWLCGLSPEPRVHSLSLASMTYFIFIPFELSLHFLQGVDNRACSS